MDCYKIPIAVFDIHEVCNQRCSYCVAHNALSDNFGRISSKDSVKKIMNFFSNHKPFNIVFTGGEPLITPGIEDIFKSFIRFGHAISLQSNFNENIESFLNSVPPEMTGWILTTFHSVQLKKFNNFFDNVSYVKRKGYPIAVKLVLDELMLPKFTEIYDILKKNNIGVILSPVIYFSPNDKPMPKVYSSQEWSRITPKITLLSSWLYFAGGFNSFGTLCSAGQSLFYMRASNGAIHGCSHSFPRDIGNIYTNEFSPLRGVTSCGLSQCICDFHYYSGIIPNINENHSFKELLMGNMQNVSFDSYLDWLAQEKIDPVLNLEEALNGGKS